MKILQKSKLQIYNENFKSFVKDLEAILPDAIPEVYYKGFDMVCFSLDEPPLDLNVLQPLYDKYGIIYDPEFDNPGPTHETEMEYDADITPEMIKIDSELLPKFLNEIDESISFDFEGKDLKRSFVVEYDLYDLNTGDNGKSICRIIGITFVLDKSEILGGKFDGMEVAGSMRTLINPLLEIFDYMPKITFNFLRLDRKKSQRDYCVELQGDYTDGDDTMNFTIALDITEKRKIKDESIQQDF